MQRLLIRNALAIAAALATLWLLDLLYSAVFLVHIDGPPSRMHAPHWLEPMEPVARLLRDMIPAAVLGALVTSRAWAWAAAISLACFYASPVLSSSNRDFYFSAEGFAQALTFALVWAVTAVAASGLARQRRPRTSRERTLER